MNVKNQTGNTVAELQENVQCPRKFLGNQREGIRGYLENKKPSKV